MRTLTFRLITLASFCFLLFSLYLNFLYKENKSEFAPVHNKSSDSTIAAKQFSHIHLQRNVSEQN